MQASLLLNGHVVGTGKASRQSLSQSPVLGRHGNKQRGAREMGDGARERHTSARLSLIQLHAVAMTPSSMDTPCASQTSGLTPCSAALFLSHRQAPPPLTQTHTQPHTPSYTPHTLLTHSSLTHTYPHILLTHLNTSFEHSSHTPQTHTLFTPTYTLTHTHPHTLTHTHSSYPHTHTPSRTPHLHTYTHIHTHNHRAYRSEDIGSTGTQGRCSHTRHVERV